MERNTNTENKYQHGTVTNFSDWFQREYFKRRKKNESYSIRAFAKYLGLDAATVSQLFSGKRRPSIKFVNKLFLSLEVTPKERELILKSFSKKNESPVEKENQKYQMIALDSFKIISDWYHYAILELISISDFKFDYLWIANQLNISVPEARKAVERLLRQELVEEKNGTLVKTNDFITNYEEGLTNSALKQLQRHILEKALEAIDLVPSEEKDITSMTMAIDESKLPEAKKLIKKFRRQMCDYLEEGHQTRVFNLAIQLYPISKKNKKQETL